MKISEEKLLSEGAFSCDQCFKKHQKCDKQLPICFRCQRNEIICTFNRTIKYKKILKKTVDENNQTSELAKQYSKKQGRIVLVTNFFKKTKSSPCKVFLKKWLVNSSSCTVFSYVSFILGFSLFDSSNLQKLELVQLMYKLKMPVVKKQPLISQYVKTNILREQELAIKSYFHYVNPFFPLFSPEKYHSSKRSVFLKASIFRTGLQFLPKTDVRNKVSAGLDELLLKFIKPSNLKPSLDSLQALLVLSLGAITHPFNKYRRSLFYIAMSWLKQLRLDLQRSNPFVEEIQMAMNFMLIHDFIYSRDFDCSFVDPIYFDNTSKAVLFNPLSSFYKSVSFILKNSCLHLRSQDLSLSCLIRYLNELNTVTQKTMYKLNFYNSQDVEVQKVFVTLLYHLFFVMILDLIFTLKYKFLKNNNDATVLLLRQSGYVHSLLLIKYLIPIGSGPFLFMRQFMLLTASRVLNSWSKPSSPKVYQIVKRIIKRTQGEVFQANISFSLAILDEYFMKKEK